MTAGYAAAIVAIAAVASTAVAVYGQYQASQNQAAAMEYNAMLQMQQGAYQRELAGYEAALIERQAAGVGAMAAADAAMVSAQSRDAMARAAAAQQASEASGRVREASIRRNYERTQSDVRMAVGASGVDTTGSPLLVLLENADTVGQELALNDYQTALDVYGAKLDASAADPALKLAAIRTAADLRANALMGEAQLRRFGGNAAALGAFGSANLLGQQAGGTRRAGYYNAGATLLSGLGAAATPYLRYGYGSKA